MDLRRASASLSVIVALAGCCLTAMQLDSRPPSKVQNSAIQANSAYAT